MRHRLFAALALAVCSPACATGTPDSGRLPAEEYTGYLTRSAEGSWFEPCGAGGERWWVTFTGRSVTQIQEAALSGKMRAGERTFVRWRAARTDEQHVGPGGPALLVRDIHEVRPATGDDCAAP